MDDSFYQKCKEWASRDLPPIVQEFPVRTELSDEEFRLLSITNYCYNPLGYGQTYLNHWYHPHFDEGFVYRTIFEFSYNEIFIKYGYDDGSVLQDEERTQLYKNGVLSAKLQYRPSLFYDLFPIIAFIAVISLMISSLYFPFLSTGFELLIALIIISHFKTKKSEFSWKYKMCLVLALWNKERIKIKGSKYFLRYICARYIDDNLSSKQKSMLKDYIEGHTCWSLK